MEIRHPANPRDFETYTSERVRNEFLVRDLFLPGQIRLIYSHFDRMIIGGVCPNEPLSLKGLNDLGTEFFLERREMGLMNVGPRGWVTVDGQKFPMDTRQGLYIGMGKKEIMFSSDDNLKPSHFYFTSGPAHKAYPPAKIGMADAQVTRLGSAHEANIRTIYKYIHPAGVQSCQLVMGMTVLSPNSVWNSMPCHTHERRMEVYFYFDLPENAVLFHFMGKPDKTRHIVVRNEEAVISPSWSIHSGAGTCNYSFIWAMLGENQTFDDMDAVAMADLM
jgi:4-deoxy-L-threo-5-hexosulose-uronate ketol-isomerase